VGRNNYHHGDLRRALVDAAQRLVTRSGAPQVSIRAIAKEAGVSPAAPYHHFADREALLAEVGALGFASLASAMERAAAAAGEERPLQRLQAAGVAYVRFAVENPEIFRLMFSATLANRSRFPRLQTAAQESFDVLQGMLMRFPSDPEEGAGALRPVPLTAWSAVHGLAFLFLEGILDDQVQALSPEEITLCVTRVLARGLDSARSTGPSD
jgi:AcrR family transcriptional regulator